MKYLMLFLALLAIQPVHAQKKLSLKEAVLGRWSTFRPEQLNNLQWIDDGTFLYSRRKGKQYYMADRTGLKDSISLSTIQKATGADLKRLPRIKSLDANRFYFRNSDTYFLYNRKDNTGKILLKYPKDQTGQTDYNPSKNLLAYSYQNNLMLASPENARIKVTDFKNPDIVAGQAIARREFGITKGTFWSPKGNYLAFYQKDESDVADYPLLDIRPTPGKLETTKYPMAGQPSEHATIGIYDIASKETLYLNIQGKREQYLTNLSWSPDEKYLLVAVLNREQNHMQLQLYDRSTGQLTRTITEERNDRWVEPEHPAWFMPGSNSEFLWFSEANGFMHLYKYNINGDSLGQITDGQFVVQEILGMDRRGRDLLIKTTDESGLNNRLRTVDLKRGKVSYIPTSNGQHSFQLDPSGTFVLDAFSNVDTPHEVTIYGTSGKKVRTVFTADNPAKDYALGETELLDLQAEDGSTLHARMIKPVDFDPSKTYPVLVYVYGGPHAQLVQNKWMAGASPWMHYMAGEGYIVFTLDNRGSANRGFEFESIIHRQLGTVEMEDQIKGVNYLKSLDYVDQEKMAVHGWSFGGFMTTSMMLRKPGTFKVGVAGGPVTDWKYYEVMYGERYMDQPKENEEGYQTTRLHNYADQLEGDLLLIHGTVDDVVVMQHNLSLIEAFIKAEKLVDFFPYPMHKHNVYGKDRYHLMKKIFTYIQDKLETN